MVGQESWPGLDDLFRRYHEASSDPHCEVPHDDLVSMIDALSTEVLRLRAEAIGRKAAEVGPTLAAAAQAALAQAERMKENA